MPANFIYRGVLHLDIIVGQLLYLKLPFADGGLCTYKRTFLVFEVAENRIKLFNASSISGKAHKLLFRSNIKVNNYWPPFKCPTFVKIDAVYDIEYLNLLDTAILANGQTLNTVDLNNILSEYELYNDGVHTVAYNKAEVKSFNW